MTAERLSITDSTPTHRNSDASAILRTAYDNHDRDGSSESPVDEDGSESGKPAKRPKRSRACIACRGMKIRCLPVEGQEACLGCSKVNRECIMPGPARKRQKTVHKVAELEKKINALTEALVAKTQAEPTPPNHSPANERPLEPRPEAVKSDLPQQVSDSSIVDKIFEQTTQTDVLKSLEKLRDGDARDDYVDIITRGLIKEDNAFSIFDHFRYQMSPYFPVAVFPNSVKPQDIRKARPMLFLAIVTISSPIQQPVLQQDLVTELGQQIAYRVLFLGEKSLDLAQALLIYSLFYVRPRIAKDLAFNQLIHAGVTMCLDLGIGKYSRQIATRDTVEEAEIRRLWLGYFYAASSVATLLRHPSMVHWSLYMDECIEFFDKSKSVLPGDKWMCSLATLQRLTLEVSSVFNMDDPTLDISFTEPRTLNYLKSFEKELKTWKELVPPEVDKRLVEHLSNSVNIYIHEIAIHYDHNVDDFRAPFLLHNVSTPSKQNRGSFVTTAQIDSLGSCLNSCHRVLDVYLSSETEFGRSINNYFMVWNTYAAVALIKLDGVLNAKDSKFQSIFTQDLQVAFYLESLSAKLTDVASDGHWPPAEAFGYITKKLMLWHAHKKAPSFNEMVTNKNSIRLNGIPASTSEAVRKVNKFGLPEDYSASFPPIQSDLNAAFNAANYNLNWDELDFSTAELDAFDTYMNDVGYMGYLL